MPRSRTPEFARPAVLNCMLAAALGLSCQPASAETLKESVLIALGRHPQILGAQRNAEAIRHEVTGARNQNNVRFGLIAEPALGYQRGEGRNRQGDLGAQAIKPIYDGGRIENETEKQLARLLGANYSTEAARSDIAMRVADAYVEVVKQSELVGLARDYVNRIAALRKRVQQIVAYDKGRGYDLLQTESRLSQAQIIQADREGQLADARTALEQLTGQPIHGYVAPPPADPRIESLQEAMASLNEHPAIRAGRAEVEAARKAAAVASAWDKPSVNLRGRVNSPYDRNGNRQWFGGYDVALVTDWNPFDGGVGAAAAAAANAQILTAEETVANTRRTLETDVAKHWTQIETRKGRVDTRAALVESTRKVRAAYWEQFQIGKRSIVDLLNAENEIYQARLGAAIEQQELEQARYRLLGSTGQLLPRLGIEALPPVTEENRAASGQNPRTPALPELN
ncbi:MAG: TolC family protein [Lautropia sp.]|nr:TolC family protein [Lautropia sp.]